MNKQGNLYEIDKISVLTDKNYVVSKVFFHNYNFVLQFYNRFTMTSILSERFFFFFFDEIFIYRLFVQKAKIQLQLL